MDVICRSYTCERNYWVFNSPRNKFRSVRKRDDLYCLFIQPPVWWMIYTPCWFMHSSIFICISSKTPTEWLNIICRFHNTICERRQCRNLLPRGSTSMLGTKRNRRNAQFGEGRRFTLMHTCPNSRYVPKWAFLLPQLLQERIDQPPEILIHSIIYDKVLTMWNATTLRFISCCKL